MNMLRRIFLIFLIAAAGLSVAVANLVVPEIPNGACLQLGSGGMPNTIGKMIKAGECDVKVLTTTAKWFGVTYAEDKPDVIAKLNALIDAGEYPKNGLWN